MPEENYFRQAYVKEREQVASKREKTVASHSPSRALRRATSQIG